MKSERWGGTLNNYTVEEESSIIELGNNAQKIEYLCFGKEFGEGGTPRIQFVIIFLKKIQLADIKKIIPRADLSVIGGTKKQASDVCKKYNNFTEIGKIGSDRASQAGDQDSLYKGIWAASVEGKFFDGRIPDDVYKRDRKHIEYIHYKYRPLAKSLEQPCGIWLYGPNRFDNYTFPDAYWTENRPHWNGYQDEKVVIVDCIKKTNPNNLRQNLLRWADRYNFSIEVGHRTYANVRPDVVIVISSIHPSEIFSKTDIRNIDQILGRFSIVKMDELKYSCQ
jgi:hypothetical protein